MTAKLTLFTRKDCCLCDEMKAVIERAREKTAFDLDEVDIDTDPALRVIYNDQVPVLFIDERKAFKYRVTAAELSKKLARKRRPFISRLVEVIGKGRA